MRAWTGEKINQDINDILQHGLYVEIPIDHYDDVIMTMLAFQITSLMVVYSIVYWGVNQRKHRSSASLAFVREIHRGPVNFPHKWPVTRKMFPFDDVIMTTCFVKSHTKKDTYQLHIVFRSWGRISKLWHWRHLGTLAGTRRSRPRWNMRIPAPGSAPRTLLRRRPRHIRCLGSARGRLLACSASQGHESCRRRTSMQSRFYKKTMRWLAAM